MMKINNLKKYKNMLYRQQITLLHKSTPKTYIKDILIQSKYFVI